MKALKKTTAVVFAGLALAGLVGGCITKIHVIDGKSDGTNNVQRVSGSFNDETYIWESWSFSTNRVVR